MDTGYRTDDLTPEEVEAERALYGPFTEAVRDLVDAGIRTTVPAEEVRRVLGALVTGGWLEPGAVVVVERSAREEPFAWPTPLTGIRDRRYGEALLRYGRLP